MNRDEKIKKVQELIAEREDMLNFINRKLAERQKEVEEHILIIESAKEMLMRLEAEREDDEEN